MQVSVLSHHSYHNFVLKLMFFLSEKLLAAVRLDYYPADSITIFPVLHHIQNAMCQRILHHHQ